MENNNLDLPGNDKNWLDDILGTNNVPQELGPDELAVHAAGLTHPNDVELEKILSEDWDNIPDPEPEQAEPPEPVILPPAFETDSDYEVELSLDEFFQDDTAIPETVPEKISTDSLIDNTVLMTPRHTGPIENTDMESTQYFAPAIPVDGEPAETVSDVKEDEPKKKERKIRPKFKKGYGLFGIPHVLSTGIWLTIILVIGLICGVLLWECTADLMAFGWEDQTVTITIEQDWVKVNPDGTKIVDITAIANLLAHEDVKLIKYPMLFIEFAKRTKKTQDIDAGTYTLNRNYDYNALINHMTTMQAARKQIEILIPEGYTCAQIFRLLEENGVCSVAKMEEYMVEIQKPDSQGNLAFSGYWFLEGVPREGKYWLEGFMFPDTYRFYVDDNPENVVKKFMDGFDYRFTKVMMEKLETIKDRTGLDLSIRDVVIIASMIQKESADVVEYYDVSSVIYNRLKNTSYETQGRLELDATLIYALDGNVDPTTGETKPLTNQDKIDLQNHPYNTYVIKGLPPGAISNPGRDALDAALSPNETNYYYYVLNPQEHKHIFATTLYEHEKNIAYVNSLK